MNRMQERYQKDATTKLKTEFSITNVHQIPRLEKVVLNIGTGRISGDNRGMETALQTLRKISGQQPVSTTSKKSIAGFKLRAGQKVGLKVTLRKDRMYEFLDRLVSVVIPRMRDFHGLSRTAFDPAGNYSLGINDQSVFPELSYEDTTFTHGLEITIVTSATDREQGTRLLELLGFPLEKGKARG